MFSKQLAKFKNKTKIMTSLRVSGPLRSLRILRIERIGSGNNNKFIALQLYFTFFTLFLQYLQAFFKVTMKAFTFYFHCVTYSRLQDIENNGSKRGVFFSLMPKNQIWVHKEPFSEQLFKEPFFCLKNKEPFVEWKASMDVKGSLWNHQRQ